MSEIKFDSAIIKTGTLLSDHERKYVRQEPYVGEDGIMVPINDYVPEGCASIYKCLITKELFIEAYNKYIKGEE